MLSINFRILFLFSQTSEICYLLMPNSWAKFVPFSPLTKREIIIYLSLIDRTARFRFVDVFLIFCLIWHVFDFTQPSRKELMKHEIHFATKQLSQSDISWTHQNISLSRRTFEFWKVHRIIRCFNNLLKGLLGFLRLWVFKITTN